MKDYATHLNFILDRRNLKGPPQMQNLFYQNTALQGRRKRGAGGALAKQLTLSQPGGQIIPTTVLRGLHVY